MVNLEHLRRKRAALCKHGMPPVECHACQPTEQENGSAPALASSPMPEPEPEPVPAPIPVVPQPPTFGLRGQMAKVLTVAHTLKPGFSKNELIVAVWKAYPQEFGLEGYKMYPDSNKLASILYGQRGLVKQGYLIAVGQGYRCGTAAEIFGDY
jgi:hypothetical protein